MCARFSPSIRSQPKGGMCVCVCVCVCGLLGDLFKLLGGTLLGGVRSSILHGWTGAEMGEETEAGIRQRGVYKMQG